MRFILTLVAAPGALSEAVLADAQRAVGAAGAQSGEVDWLSPGRAVDIPVAGEPQTTLAAVEAALGEAPVDRALLPAEGRRKRLLFADMDSTILTNETLNEIAAEVGIGDKVAEITARGMRGEIGFEESLIERVGLLTGRDAAIIEPVLNAIDYSSGAHALVATMRTHGAIAALISGGFTMFTDKVQAELGFHASRANVFDIVDGTLTGELGGPIVGRESKQEWLVELAAKHGIAHGDALAIGDGANDLAMIEAAGLGIAYFGKPVLRAAAQARIDHTDLRTALYYQGYRDDEIVEGWG